MKNYYGNYLGVVVNGGEHDPEGRGRCQVFVPHIMPTLYEGWNREGENIEFNIVGDGLPTGLSPDIVDRLKQVLPWAECAAPIVGASPCVKNGSSTLRNTNYYDGYTQDSFSEVGSLEPDNIRLLTSAAAREKAAAGYCGVGVRQILTNVFKYEQGGTGDNLIKGKVPASGANGSRWDGFFNNLGWKPKPVSSPSDAPPGSFLVYKSDTDLNQPLTKINGKVTGGATQGHVEFVGLNSSNQKVYLYGQNTPSLRPGGSVPQNFTGVAWIPPQDRLAIAAKKVGGVDVNFTAYSAGDLGQGLEGRDMNNDPTLDSNANINAYAKKIRSSLAQELDSNPALEEKLIRMTQAEVGSQGLQAQQAFIETVFNRAAATGQSLNSILDISGGASSGYYRQNFQTVRGTTRWNTAQQELLRGGSGLRDNYNIIINSVISGSNITGGATDNASSRFAQNILSGSSQRGELNKNAANNTIGGELFYTKNRFSEGGLAPLIGSGPTGESIAKNTATIQNPASPEEFTSIGPPTNNQALGMFGYASEGTAVWVFFREGNPMFPVYFAASYGAAEWQNMYQHSSNGIGAGKGGAIPGTEKMCANYYGGGFDSAQVTEDSGLEPDATFRVFGKTGSQLLFTKDHIEFTSTNNMRQHVFGDNYDLTEANKESRVRGNKNTYVEQDVFITIGNWSEEAMDASDEIQQYINEAMEIKSRTT